MASFKFMEEEDIIALEANGYSYWGGALIDNEGNYLPSLELNGVTYKSELDEETFKIDWEENKRREAEDPYSNLQRFENGPLYNTSSEYPMQNFEKQKTMEEDDIIALEANGYSYWGGALIDNEGNYLPSLELNGKKYTSETDEATFRIDWEENKKSLNEERSISIRHLEEFTKENKTTNSNNSYVEKKQIVDDYSHFYNYSIGLILSILTFLIIKRISK